MSQVDADHIINDSHSPAPHIQISFSLGSPAVYTHSPVTPPESASSWFPLGRLPVEAENTHRYEGTNRNYAC